MISFPVKVGLSTDLATYVATLVAGEKQLLITSDSKKLFLTNGDGTSTDLSGTVSGVDQATLDTALADYTKTSDLATALSDFVNSAELTAALASYVATADLSSITVGTAGTLTGLTATVAELNTAATDAHTHANDVVLDGITIVDGKLQYNSQPLLNSVDTSALTVTVATLETF